MISSVDPSRAAAFYERVFGYPTERLADGTYRFNRASEAEPDWISVVGEPHPARALTALGVYKVASVEETVRRVRLHSGTVLLVTNGPRGTPIAICRDTESNAISIEQAVASEEC